MKATRLTWLASAVLVHFLITLVHGAAHAGAEVPLGPAAALFVFLVIEVAPLAGLVAAIRYPRGGGSLVAASMAGALAFGFINHFLVASPDHVAHVAPAWRTMFAGSAVLLVLSESAGIVAGLWMARLAEARS